MAVTADVVEVRLEANTTQYLRNLSTAQNRFAGTLTDIQKRASQASSAVTASLGRIGLALGAAGIIKGSVNFVDASTRITNSLKVAGLEGEKLKSVYDSLFASAQRNAAPLEALAQLYGRATLSQKGLKASTQDLLKFTENVSLALRVNGASAEQSSGALLQLSQLLSSGTVRAEEFNSVQEGALPILQAVAAGLKEAGGSVAKLRSLVIDGKLSSAAFFAAFEAGSSILTDKVAGASFTAEQGFVRLQNTLQDLAGKFNENTGASKTFITSLDGVSDALGRLENSKILSFLGKLNDVLQGSGFLQLDSSLKEIERILGALDSAAGAVGSSFDGLADSTRDAIAAALGFENIADAPAALRAKIEELATSLNTGKTDANELRSELTKLGASPLNLAIQVSQIMDLARAAIAASGAVAAINGGGVAAAGIALQRDEQRQIRASTSIKQTSIADNPVLPKSKTGKARTPEQKFSDDLRDQGLKNEALKKETALRATLNPLVNDYGYAIEKLRVQQELENAATKAGLALTPDRISAISALAETYATAHVAAERLDETQTKLKASAEAWASTLKDATRGFIDDLIEGKSAAEAFSNVLSSVANKLLDLGLDSIFSSKGGIGSIIGSFFGGTPTRATGGPIYSGGPTLVGEKGPELFVPSGPGKIVPNSQIGGGGGAAVTFNVDNRGADVAAVARLEAAMQRLAAEVVPTIRKEIASGPSKGRR